MGHTAAFLNTNKLIQPTIVVTVMEKSQQQAWETAAQDIQQSSIMIRHNRIHQRQYLTPRTRQYKVRVDVLLAKLLSHIDTDGAVTIIDVTLYSVAEDTISVTYFLKLNQT